MELSAVAQELTRLDKFSAQAWCAAGNCFSRQKEHENAIKFFNRAIQVIIFSETVGPLFEDVMFTFVVNYAPQTPL